MFFYYVEPDQLIEGELIFIHDNDKESKEIILARELRRYEQEIMSYIRKGFQLNFDENEYPLLFLTFKGASEIEPYSIVTIIEKLDK